MSVTAVGIMSLQTLVASTSRAILLRPTDNNFHAINYVVALDHPNFCCKCAMYRGSIYAHCNWCLMLLVINIPWIWRTIGHYGSKATCGRYFHVLLGTVHLMCQLQYSIVHTRVVYRTLLYCLDVLWHDERSLWCCMLDVFCRFFQSVQILTWEWS